MADFKVLLAEMTDSGELDLSDHVRRCPSVWLVYGNYDSLGIIFDVPCQRRRTRFKYQCFQIVLFTRYLVDACLMTAALECLRKPCVSDLYHCLERNEASRHDKYVGIVVLLDELAYFY